MKTVQGVNETRIVQTKTASSNIVRNWPCAIETRIVQIGSASSNIMGQFSQERLLITVIFSIIEASARRGIIANFDMRTVQGVNETRIVQIESASSNILECQSHKES